jgi:hypothetical protein
MRVQLNANADGSNKIAATNIDFALTGLSNLIASQISSADAAVKDWRDLAPAEVDEEITQYRKEEG